MENVWVAERSGRGGGAGESPRKILLWGSALQGWWSDRLGKEIVSTWAAGIVLGIPSWFFIEIFWRPDSILGDGGLAAFGLLIILAIATPFDGAAQARPLHCRDLIR